MRHQWRYWEWVGKLKVTTILSERWPIEGTSENRTLGVAKRVAVTAGTELPEVVLTSNCRIVAKKGVQTAKPTDLVLHARGMYDVHTNFPFWNICDKILKTNCLTF